MVCDEARGARRVVGGARAEEPEHVGDAPATYAVRRSGEGVDADKVWSRAEHEVHELGGLDGDVHTRRAVLEMRAWQAGTYQRRIATLHHGAVLRVHARGLRAGDCEARVVEELRALKEGAVRSALQEPVGSPDDDIAAQGVGHLAAVPARERSHGAHVRTAGRHAAELLGGMNAHRCHHLQASQANVDTPQRMRCHGWSTGREVLLCCLWARQLLAEACDFTTRRMVEHERARERRNLGNSVLQQLVQLGRSERVEARFHQRRVCVDETARGALHHLKHRLECDLNSSRAGVVHRPATDVVVAAHLGWL